VELLEVLDCESGNVLMVSRFKITKIDGMFGLPQELLVCE